MPDNSDLDCPGGVADETDFLHAPACQHQWRGNRQEGVTCPDGINYSIGEGRDAYCGPVVPLEDDASVRAVRDDDAATIDAASKLILDHIDDFGVFVRDRETCLWGIEADIVRTIVF